MTNEEMNKEVETMISEQKESHRKMIMARKKADLNAQLISAAANLFVQQINIPLYMLKESLLMQKKRCKDD